MNIASTITTIIVLDNDFFKFILIEIETQILTISSGFLIKEKHACEL